MATIKDVAQLAGVSVSTVSKLLNGGNVLEENAKAIRKAIEELDYRVNPFARSLKTQKTRTIGVLIPEMTAPFFGNVIRSLDQVLREHGYHTLVSCYSSSYGLERENLHFLINNGIDGLIYAPENVTAEEFYDLIANTSIPMVQIDRRILGVNTDTVLVNNADAAYIAVTHLLNRGHQRIATITGPKGVYSAMERLVGYLRALSDHRIRYDDSLVISDQYKFVTGYKALDTLLQLPDPPTAIFATSYDLTIGLITALRERGLNISKDLEVIGFDCMEICTIMNPPLPVVYQPETDIGKTAAEFMIQRLDGYMGEPRVATLKCKFTL
jgi:LacI family transcriptional regulator